MSAEPPGPRTPLTVQEAGFCPSLVLQTPHPQPPPPLSLQAWITKLAPAFQLNVGNACNQACVHCALDRQGSFRTAPDEAKALAGAARELGLDTCCITGGEPTVWPHLFSVLAAFQKMGVKRVVMHTNGLMLSYPRYLPRLEEHGVDTLICSYDHHEPAQQRSLSQREDTPELLDLALDHLAASPIQTALHTVCTARLDGVFNRYAEHVLRTADAFREVPAVVLSPLRHPALDTPAFDTLALRYSRLMPQLHAAVGVLERHIPVLLRGVPFCLAGDLAPKCQENYVAVNTVNPTEPFGTAAPVGAASARCCGLCPHVDRCPGVPDSYIRRFGTEEFPSLFKQEA